MPAGENQRENIHQEKEVTKEEVVHSLIDQSRIGTDFYILLTISVLITTFGLLLDNAPVVIGGMLIAPLLSPILALGLGIVTANKESIMRSVMIILKASAVGVIISFITAFLIDIGEPRESKEILQRITPSLPFMYIAILSGVGATYAWAKPKLSAKLPGIAVVVALVPPICTTGIGLATFDKHMITGSFELYLINLVGIAASAAVTFSLLGFYQMKWVEQREIIEEKIEKKEEEEEAQKEDETFQK